MAWTPEFSVSRRYLVEDPQAPEQWAAHVNAAVQWAPDGAHFFFLEAFSELDSDENVIELRIFDLRELMRRPTAGAPRLQPLAAVERRSARSNAPPISSPRWDATSQGIVFLSPADGGSLQAFRFDLQSRRLVQLSNHTPALDETATFHYENGVLTFQQVEGCGDRTLPYPVLASRVRREGGTMVRRCLRAFRTTGAGELERRVQALEMRQPENARPAPLTGSARVQVIENLNEPARVVYDYDGVHQELTSPELSLATIERARWRMVEWVIDGARVRGALMLPPARRPPGRLPLVIQAYHFEGEGDWSERFLPDGLHNGTTDAAQALAARGFAVLWMDAWAPGAGQSRMAVGSNLANEEGPRFVRSIDQAVSSLAAAGIVDATRIGLTGFSRAGYLTHFAISHPGRIRLAAAIADDSFLGTFEDYARDLADDSPIGITANYGPTSFWSNRELWLERVPLFNADHIETPILATFNGEAGLSSPGAAALEGALRFLRVPHEIQFFPSGMHQLRAPRQRLALLRTTIDWMAFWLRGEEGADPPTTDQFARWHLLRDEWRRRLARQ